METEAPSGTVMVYPRRIDLENTRRLMDFDYTRVVTGLQSLEDALGIPTPCQNISSF